MERLTKQDGGDWQQLRISQRLHGNGGELSTSVEQYRNPRTIPSSAEIKQIETNQN